MSRDSYHQIPSVNIPSDWIPAIVAAVVLVIAIVLRARGHEIKWDDALIALMAGVFMLLTAGKIAKLVIGEKGVTIETVKQAILKSADETIADQVTKLLPVSELLPVEEIRENPKGGIEEIPTLIRKETQGLDLFVGSGGYKPNDFRVHLEELTGYDFFRFIILKRSDGPLFGMFDARSLKSALMGARPIENLDVFITRVNRATKDDLQNIKNMPGFFSPLDAVRCEDEKSKVLEKMQQTRRSWLPVIGSDSTLAGIVRESSLIASMILDVNRRLRRTSS